MPCKIIENFRIGRAYSRKTKLTDTERQEIADLYGSVSQRKLAKMYGVSRRLIVFIGCPEKRVENLRRRTESGGSKQYYDREKNRLAAASCREYKRAVLTSLGINVPTRKLKKV